MRTVLATAALAVGIAATITWLAAVRGTARVSTLGGTKTPPGHNSAAPARHAGNSGVRTLRFSGYDWAVKSSQARVGPGPNYFSDSTKNVWVDDQGRLHLRITRREDRWLCAEVVSARSFGYGTYRFYLDSPPENLQPDVVLGLFTWSDAPAFAHREIDFELAQWGDPNNQNAQFVIQPYTRPQNIRRFQIPAAMSATTQSFEWQKGKVICRSLKGHDAAASVPAAVLYEWTFTEGIPEPGDENARMNLWLMRRRGPAEGTEVEVVVRKFEFVPPVEKP